MLLFSIPAVQTRLGKYATNKLKEDFGTNIIIERVGLQFNGDVELKNIYVEDHKNDTLIKIDELNASIISFRKLYNNKFTFGDVDIEGLRFNLKTYKGEKETNLDIFVAKFDEDVPSKSEGGVFLLSSSEVSISKSLFTLIDENLDNSTVFTFKDLNINATDFLILGPKVSARINKLGFKEKRGVAVENLSTNFAYTREDMTFDFLQIKTEKSLLKGDLKFEYKREDLQYFVDKVKVSANFTESDIALSDLNAFYNEFGKGLNVKLNATISGTLNDLTVNDVLLTSARNTRIDGDFIFKNIFNKEEHTFVMNANFERLTSSYSDLNRLLPEVLGETLPPILENFNTFSIEGHSVITSKTINADIEIASLLGGIVTNFHMDDIDAIDKTTYGGNIVLNEFDMGTFINDPNVGMVSLNIDINGSGFNAENANVQVRGNVFALGYNDYLYNDVKIAGNVRNKIFDGNLIASDPNLKMNFNGLVDFSETVKKYDFTANVFHADLKALNFAKNDDISIFKSLVSMNMNGSSFDDAYGNVTFKNTLYKNENDEYYFKDFAISSKFTDDVRYISINSPDIIEGDLSGKFVFKDVFNLLENSLGDIYTNFIPHDIVSNQFINFNFKIYNKIAEVFYPELELGSNTFFRGRVESDAKKFKLTFKSPQILFQDYFAKDIQLDIDNNNPLFNTYVEIDSMNSKYYDISRFSLINVTKNDTLFIKTEFSGGKANTDNFNLNLFYTINKSNNSVLGFKKSNLKFKENTWYVNEEKNKLNKIVFDRLFHNINIESLKLSHQQEEISLSGVLRDSTYKKIGLDFKDVDLAKITPRIDSLTLAGNVNGKLNFNQQRGDYIPESNVVIDDFNVNNFNLGSFKAYIIGDNTLTNYRVNVSLKGDETESLSVYGNIDFTNNNSSLNLDVNFNTFILDPLNPFGEGVITDIRGEITGGAKVTGRLQRPQIKGELNLDKGGLRVPYLNVDYAFNDGTSIDLEQQNFVFNNAVLTDSEFSSNATLSGVINHVNFSNWALNLNIDSNRLLVLNTSDSEDALYYGTAFVGGNINIVGPTDEMVIKANVESEPGTVFKIPLNDTESFGDNSYIHFLSPEEKKARSKGESIVLNDIKGLEMDFDLDINENAEIEIVMDRNSGSSIRGRGNGLLLAEINTNGKFNMYGDFIVREGVYNFIYGGLVQKEFRVLNGGTLAWGGRPLDAIINIEAVYDKIEANPSVLLDNPINRSIPVEVKIQLTESLEKPILDFDLSFPSVNSTLNSELKYRLNDDESKQFQALSLLTTGSFKSDLSFDSQDWVGLVSDRAKAMLNEILSSEDGKLDFGLDFQLGQNTPDFETDSRVGVTVSTKLSDRILVNGKVGVPIGGVNQSVIAGDFEIEMQLNEDRTLSLKFFNRENNIRNFGEEIGYTQGVGLSYNVEFDNLKELFKKIFSKDNRLDSKQKNDGQKAKNAQPEFINFKAKDTVNSVKSNII